MTTPEDRSPGLFVALVFCFSVPFWVLGATSDAQLMPGLSVSALMAFCPVAAAVMLVSREGTAGGVAALLRRSFDLHRIADRRWYIPTFLLMAAINVMVYGLMRMMGVAVPSPQVSVPQAILMSIAFFVGALGEELGWSAYALDPMLARMSALRASVVLGIVAAAWHLVPLLLLDRSPVWIAWWCLYALASRILVVWLYTNTNGSVGAVALFHATLNLTYMLFPRYGSHFDMRLGGLVMAFVAAVVTIAWGPATLTRHMRRGWTGQ
jgi:membrane protease YdiL (CAAX protease family)